MTTKQGQVDQIAELLVLTISIGMDGLAKCSIFDLTMVVPKLAQKVLVIQLHDDPGRSRLEGQKAPPVPSCRRTLRRFLPENLNCFRA